MTRPAFACVAVAVVIASVSITGRQTQFRSSTDVVEVYATVKLKDGVIAHDLTREDFELLDDGKPREIAVFSRSVQPLSVALILDHSGSTDKDFDTVKLAAQDFVGRLLKADRAAVRTLTWDCMGFTDDRLSLVGMLRLQTPPDFGSPIWAATDAAMSALAEESGRRVILLFSDGDDTQNAASTFSPAPAASAGASPFSACQAAPALERRSIADVMKRVETDGVMVYTVGVEGTGLRTYGLGDMSRLAQRSGAEYRLLKDYDQLRAAFVSIADELHLQYLLGFVPAAFDGKRHDITVRVKRSGVTVRARKAYVATRGGS
ncbi:MAG TPA: VWA domain-containing protein [Vicinamibacterales bacterium]|nr:VWA domain-containing protein [Vicinamibacterales bacterium]